MNTLLSVELVMRERKAPMSVREIVEMAGTTLPTRSKTPDTVVARDLSVDIKRHGDASRFVRTAPGRYTLREYVEQGLIAMGDVGTQPLLVRKNTGAPASLARQALEKAGPRPSFAAAPNTLLPNTLAKKQDG